MTTTKLNLLFIICCIVTSCSSQQNIKLISKAFPKFGITLSLPEEWHFKEGSENVKNKIFNCYYKEPENNTPYNTVSVGLSYDLIPTPTNSDTLFNQIKRMIKGQVSNNEVTDYAVENVQGRPTKAYKFNNSINKIQITSISIYFIEQNVLYRFNAMVFPDKLDFYKKTISDILASIQIGKLDPSLLSSSPEFKTIESRYINNKYGFEIDFPVGWFFIEDINGNAIQVKKANQDASETISMGVSIQQDYDSKMTPEQHNQDIIRIMRKQLLIADNAKISSNKFAHSAFEAYKACFTTAFNNKKQLVFIYTTIKNTKGYLFVATTDEDHLEVNEALFDKIFKSMTIK